MTAVAEQENAEAAEPESKCGTYAGWNAHRKAGEKACDACRKACADYMRGYRQRRGPEPDRWRSRTRSAALERLAAKYPDQFARLLEQVRREHPRTAGEPS
jgi:hypothetical protein